MRTMFLTRLISTTAVGFVVALAGAIVFAHLPAWANDNRPPAPPQPPAPPAAKPPEPKKGLVLRGRIVDEQGRPLPGVTVQLYSGLATRWHGQKTITGPDGTYRFDPLETGSMIKDQANNRWDRMPGIQLMHPTYTSADGKSWWDERVPGVVGQEHVRDFTMTPGGHLEGRVVDAQGRPCPFLDLNVYQGASLNKTTHQRYATTDADGRFNAMALPAGECKVAVNDGERRYPELGRRTVEAGRTTTVTLTDIPRDNDRAKLQGAWTVVKAKGGSDDLTRVLSGNRVTVTDDSLVLADGGREVAFQLSLEPSRHPRQIDLHGKDISVRPNWLWGIYRIDGDEVTIFVTAGKKRPADFVADGAARLLVLKRPAK